MRTRHAFLPSGFSLESRFLLSRASLPHHAAITAHSRGHAASHDPKGIVGQIAGYFTSFKNDYTNAQALYIQDDNNQDGQTAFANYSRQRVYQLTQELASSLDRVAVKTKQGEQPITALRLFLENRFLKPTSSTSLLGGLNSAIPPVGTTTDGSQLYLDVAYGAIDAAKVAAINAVPNLSNGAYTGNKHWFSK
jgi:hypothetical protein